MIPGIPLLLAALLAGSGPCDLSPAPAGCLLDSSPTVHLDEAGAAESLARRWGIHGHRLAARAAAAHLPDEMPAFFRGSRAQLEYLNPEPDRWRDSGAREMNEGFRYDHYLDLEAVPEEAFEARDRWEFLRALYAAGIEEPEQEVGLLPFQVMELLQRLENGFRRWRDETNPEVRRWLEERIVHDAGILGHYVTDASQPHHATIHFNGWNEELEENPGGFTTDRQFHARFESRFVEAHVREAHVMEDFPTEPAMVDEPAKAVWDFIRDSNTRVERLYELDRDHGFVPGEPAHPESLAFATERIRAGGAFLRDLWWAAWLASGQESDGR